ncbi:23S rRNA (guanosine(2251)-2'-O)-methyltransferase RlmB [Fulvivirga sp. M361]|uniref:23S rRNA (guanosine(2251)-2'-O)-methyltransferase RlmB n=1 Tax=Fulvivirga sp. M361 TaxID=2594266 RepID=UPI00117AC7FE|nr:23S rRNA (guanosine(2251)-2'-O)-methyltransferase RlmB [Fulvivirga sp. M361]TRX53707.1 23S rRNA (guanosine(2251)-2'-O)-methyltransferase RlmB [Fulvivirga sp. M361]
MNKHSNKEFVFGIRAIIETIQSDKEIDKLFIQKNLSNPLIKELVDTARKYRIPFQQVPIEKLNRITRKNHQGAIAFISSIQYGSLDNVISEAFQRGKEPLLLLLDRITDVRNFGAIARTAECAGVDAIIVPARGGAAINSDAMKTSAGALNYIPVCREDNLKNTIRYLKDSGIKVIGCTEKTDTNIYSVDYRQPVCLILGSEEDGISGEYLRLCDEKGRIPLTGNIDSLNVSVSAAIIVYEAIRQRTMR